MKTELLLLTGHTDIYLADIGLPESAYRHFGISQPDGFRQNSLLRYLVSG